MSKSKRKKNEETKRRFEAIKDLMSTFAMSTVAVVAAVVLIPASPKAEIVKAVALSEEIVYQVNVTDEDNALDLSTLYVVVENQLEYYEQPIGLGENSGYFADLEYNTEYRLSVYGSKGFGQERLDTLMITTEAKIGGTILSVTTESIDYETNYFVDVSIYDPDAIYSSIILYYGYRWEQDPEIFYSSIDITSPFMRVALSDIYTSEPIHIYLEGTTVDGTELLDEIWVTPPFELYASVYQNYVNSQTIGFYLYNDMRVDNIEYVMNIYKNNILIRSEQIVLEGSTHEGSEFEINGLFPDTTYTFDCTAIYTNPQTLRKETVSIYQEEIVTLDTYSYEYTVEEFDQYIEVTIVVTDPNHYFHYAFYDSFDTSGEYLIYLMSESIPFVNNGATKSATFIIYLPSTETYKITIGIRNQSDYMIKQIIDNIIVE